jgi:hypothetical protein
VKDYGVKAMTALSAKVGFRVRDGLVYRNENIHQLKRLIQLNMEAVYGNNIIKGNC